EPVRELERDDDEREHAAEHAGMVAHGAGEPRSTPGDDGGGDQSEAEGEPESHRQGCEVPSSPDPIAHEARESSGEPRKREARPPRLRALDEMEHAGADGTREARETERIRQQPQRAELKLPNARKLAPGRDGHDDELDGEDAQGREHSAARTLRGRAERMADPLERAPLSGSRWRQFR